MNFKNQIAQLPFTLSHLLVLILTTLISIVLCIFSFASGNFTIVQNIIYIPIVIACVWYEIKGFIFSVAMALIYFILVIFFTRDSTTLVYALIRAMMFIFVSLSIAGLSLLKRMAMEKDKETQALLQRVIDAATKLSIIATDMSGTILMFNSGAEQMLGYSAAEVIGKKTPVLIHLESEVTARGKELTEELGHPVEGFGVFVAYAKQGKHEERKWTYIKKNGKHITVNLIVTAVKDDKGAITGFLGVATDITEKELIHKTIREVEAKFSAIVDNAPDGIIFCEIPTQEIVFSNLAMTRIFGYSQKEFFGMYVHELHRPEDWNAFVLSQYKKNTVEDVVFSRNMKALRKDGEVIFVDIAANKFSIAGKEYFTAFFREVHQA